MIENIKKKVQYKDCEANVRSIYIMSLSQELGIVKMLIKVLVWIIKQKDNVLNIPIKILKSRQSDLQQQPQQPKQ